MTQIRYSTAGIEAPRRFDYWNDVVCRHCVPAASQMLTDAAFDADLGVYAVGAVHVSTMTAPKHHWVRDPLHLRRGPDDDMWIACMADGQGLVSQEGRQASLGAGDIVLYDAGRPFHFTLAAQKIYLLRLPRRSLLERCPGGERLTARTLAAGQPGSAPLRTMVEQAVGLDFNSLRPGAAARFGSTLLDLAAATLEFQMGAEASSVTDRGLHGRVVDYIHRHFDDPELSLEGLADVHQVSSRSITRAFARHDQTAMALVWQLRLEASRRALTEGRARSVTAAAFDHGFSDVSHFSRAFRKAFGHSPGTLIQD